MYEVPSRIPENCPFRLQPEQFHVIFQTLSPSLLTYLTPATTRFLQADIQSSTPLQSKCPNQKIFHASSAKHWKPRRLYHIHTAPSNVQRHSPHPSHHHALSITSHNHYITLSSFKTPLTQYVTSGASTIEFWEFREHLVASGMRAVCVRQIKKHKKEY